MIQFHKVASDESQSKAQDTSVVGTEGNGTLFENGRGSGNGSGNSGGNAETNNIAERNDDQYNQVEQENGTTSNATGFGNSLYRQYRQHKWRASPWNFNGPPEESQGRGAKIGIAAVLLVVLVTCVFAAYSFDRLTDEKHETIAGEGRGEKIIPSSKQTQVPRTDWSAEGENESTGESGNARENESTRGSGSTSAIGDGNPAHEVANSNRMPDEYGCYSRKSEHIGTRHGPPAQYVHIPKAGGTTIQDNLERWNRLCYTHDGDHDGWHCPIQHLRHGVMMGHRGFGYCEPFSKIPNVMYLVAMRDPVSRFISEFDYFMSHNYQEFHKYHRAWRGKSLDSLIKLYNESLHTYPMGSKKLKWPWVFRGLAKQQVAFMCGYNCIGPSGRNISDAEKLARAKANLLKTDVVAIMDKLDDFVDQLRVHVNWVPPYIHHFPRENKIHGKKSTISEEASQIVREWAWTDVELYNMAAKIHEEKMENVRRCLNDTKS